MIQLINVVAFVVCIVYLVVYHKRLLKLTNSLLDDDLAMWQVALVAVVISCIPGLNWIAAILVVVDLTNKDKW